MASLTEVRMINQRIISILEKRIKCAKDNIKDSNHDFAAQKFTILEDFKYKYSHSNWSTSQFISELTEELLKAKRADLFVPTESYEEHLDEFIFVNQREKFSDRQAKLSEIPVILAEIGNLSDVEPKTFAVNDNNVISIKRLDG